MKWNIPTKSSLSWLTNDGPTKITLIIPVLPVKIILRDYSETDIPKGKIKFMPSLFWSNTIWYILLGITILIELVFIFIKVENWKRGLALFISLSGILFALDILLAALRAYEYFPKIMPQSAFDNGVIGNYFSQFSLTATAMLIAVYKLNYYWYFIFAGIYGFIEELFLKLGIYKHNWYQTWMTVVGVLLLCWLGKKFFASGSKPIRRILLYFYIFSGLITLQVHTMWIFRVLGIFSFGSGHYVPPEKAGLNLLICGVYMLIAFSVMMTAYFSKLKRWWKALIILGLFIAHYIAFQFHLMYYKAGWFLACTTLSILSLYFYIFILDKLYGQTEKG